MDSRLHSKGSLGLKATPRPLLGCAGLGVEDLNLISALDRAQGDPGHVTLVSYL